MFRHFIGGRIDTVLIKLLVFSIVLGGFLSFFEVNPYDFWVHLKELAVRIYNMGFGAFEWLLQFVLLGAVIVIPLWFLGRIWKLYVSRSR